MSRLCSHALAYLLLLSLLAQPALAADELFSRVKTEEVFAPTSRTEAKPGVPAEKQAKIATASELYERLRDSGLEPQKESDEAVTFSLQHSRWTFPLRLELVEETQKILVSLGLESPDKKPLPADRLLGLLAANAQIRPASFSFSVQRKRLELVVPLVNDNLSMRSLREELRNLATLAEKTAPAWEVTTAAPEKSAATTNPPNNPPSQQSAPKSAPAQATPSNSLIGKWSANRPNAEAFTLQLNADGSFELAHTKNGRATRSTGKYDLTGRQLTLNGNDKVKIIAEIANLAARSFEFLPGGSAAAKLTFQRAS